MRKLILLALLVAPATFADVIPVMHDGVYRTDVIFRNTTDHSVTQLIGSKTLRSEDGTIVETKTEYLTLTHGESRAFDDLGSHFDKGDRILDLTDGVTAVTFQRFLGVTAACAPAFELRAIDLGISQTGRGLFFDDIRIDTPLNIHAYATILNTGAAPVQMTALIFAPEATYGREFIAWPGVSQTELIDEMPNGGKVEIFVGSPSVGVGSVPPVYPFMANGPSDGGTQAIRYGHS